MPDASAVAPLPAAHRLHVLLVDDEPRVVEALARRLSQRGLRVTTLSDSRQVESTIESQAIDAVVLDLQMPFLDGRTLLVRLVATRPELPVVILTGQHDLQIAVSCMQAGATDFITKPVSEEHLWSVLGRIQERVELGAENLRLRTRLLEPTLEHPHAFAGIVTADPALRAAFRYLEVIAPSSHPVLVTGETGTGKELIAQAVHRLSRPKSPFVAVNVAGLDDAVLADTLFGHRKGAFTGADQPRQGLIEKAGSGTLFLDEIGDLSLTSQVKLLRLIQEREYLPLGVDQPRRMEARLVVATCRTLEDLRDPSRFRIDLYYRLKAHQVQLPPLRARPHDLPLLASHFLAEAADELGFADAHLLPDAMAVLRAHAFPGNCRELQSVMRDAVSRSGGGAIGALAVRTALGPDAPRLPTRVGNPGPPPQPQPRRPLLASRRQGMSARCALAPASTSASRNASPPSRRRPTSSSPRPWPAPRATTPMPRGCSV